MMPNIFQGTCFKKHVSQVLEEQSARDFLDIVFYLPSTTEHNEKISKFMNNVSLHPIDCLYKNFKQYSSIGDDFIPQDLDPKDLEMRSVDAEVVRNLKMPLMFLIRIVSERQRI